MSLLHTGIDPQKKEASRLGDRIGNHIVDGVRAVGGEGVRSAPEKERRLWKTRELRVRHGQPGMIAAELCRHWGDRARHVELPFRSCGCWRRRARRSCRARSVTPRLE